MSSHALGMRTSPMRLWLSSQVGRGLQTPNERQPRRWLAYIQEHGERLCVNCSIFPDGPPICMERAVAAKRYSLQEFLRLFYPILPGAWRCLAHAEAPDSVRLWDMLLLLLEGHADR